MSQHATTNKKKKGVVEGKELTDLDKQSSPFKNKMMRIPISSPITHALLNLTPTYLDIGKSCCNLDMSHSQENRYTGSLNGRDKKTKICPRYGQILYQEGRGLI